MYAFLISLSKATVCEVELTQERIVFRSKVVFIEQAHADLAVCYLRPLQTLKVFPQNNSCLVLHLLLNGLP